MTSGRVLATASGEKSAHRVSSSHLQGEVHDARDERALPSLVHHGTGKRSLNIPLKTPHGRSRVHGGKTAPPTRPPLQARDSTPRKKYDAVCGNDRVSDYRDTLPS